MCHLGAISWGGALAESLREAVRTEEIPMMHDLATTSPVLAAGWAFLYLLFGGGLGGAVLLFLALKAIKH